MKSVKSKPSFSSALGVRAYAHKRGRERERNSDAELTNVREICGFDGMYNVVPYPDQSVPIDVSHRGKWTEKV